MARSSYSVREDYIGTGLLKTYSFDFKIESLAQLLVVELDDEDTELQRVRGTDTSFIDTVTFDAKNGGGEVTLLANLPSGYRLIILLANDEPTQTFEFRNKNDFTLDRLERALDFVVGPIQRLAYLIKRSVKVSDANEIDDFDPTLPADIVGTDRGILTTNEAGDGFMMGPTVYDVINWKTAAEAAAVDAANSRDIALQESEDAAESADQSAASAVVAGGHASAASASATAAGLSQIAANDSALAAAESESNAGTSEANALQSAQDAAGSAVNALQSETNAAQSASDALASEEAAALSASEAAQSAIDAALAGTSIDIQGTQDVPVAITATGIAFSSTKYVNIWFVQGSGGAVTVTANPQIAAGSLVGQSLELLFRSDTNTLKLAHGNGLDMNGPITGVAGSSIRYLWNGTTWQEAGRSER